MIRYSKALLLLFACFSFFHSPAQYLPFPDVGAAWKVDEFNSDILIQCQGTITTVYGIQDTIVRNGVVYQKIEVFTGGACSGNPCFSLGTMEGIRTDTVTGIVYAWFNLQDTPLFDYSLQAGDTMWTYNGSFWWSGNPVVDSVDTVVLGGISRKRLHLSSDFTTGPEFIIEGVGPSYGLFVPPGMGVNGEEGTLVCYSENGNPIYSNPNSCGSGGNCLALSAENGLSKVDWEVFPNPSTGKTCVRLFGQTISSLRLHDLWGRTLVEVAGHGLSEMELDLTALPKGIYFLEMRVEEMEGKLIERMVKE